MSGPTSQELLQRYRAGQSEAATAIFNRYVQRLIALSRSRIGPKLKRRLDPEDVVQSAYRSFFVRAKNQECQLTRSGDLWRLLARMTLNKLYGQIEKQTAGKRSIDREYAAVSSLANAATLDPTGAEVVAVSEQLHLVLKRLSADERIVLTSTLQGESVEAISSSIAKSERTVHRLLARAKQRVEQQLLAGEATAAIGSPARRTRVIEPHAPLRYSDYALQQLLGSGGMGKVYRAQEKTSGKIVAVKALHKSRQSDPRAVDQFVQEAQILAKLHHPNIIRVRGLGRFPAGGYFLVMDFVDGTDLQSRLQNGSLPPSDAVGIVKQVASAVQYAHAHGIVHCDLKPGNVMLDSSNKAIVTDFGFAFIVAGSLKSATSSIGGTAGYIAPEVYQYRQPPTPAADIYGLGALLWTLSVGTVPAQTSLQRNYEGVPTALSVICAKCLAAEPENRFPTVAHFLQELNGRCNTLD